MGKNKITWTNKVQAIASIIAILGGLAGFYKLFSTDKEMQKQIDNLTIIAKEFSDQTAIMREELDNSRMRNNLLVEQLSIDKDKWTKQNRPDFAFDLEKWDSWTGDGDFTTIEGFSLTNKGGSAHLINVTENLNNTCKLIVPRTYVPSQGRLKFNLSFSDKKDIFLDINLIYKDFEGILYSQRFKSDKISNEMLRDRQSQNLDYLSITSYKPIKIEKK
jgi:hypothetical protein